MIDNSSGLRFKRLIPLLAFPAALLLSQGQAKAGNAPTGLNVRIFNDGPNLTVNVTGNLSNWELIWVCPPQVA